MDVYENVFSLVRVIYAGAWLKRNIGGFGWWAQQRDSGRDSDSGVMGPSEIGEI
jgi:hypothetical protein